MKHAPGDTGPECGATSFRFPHDFALRTDERVTCLGCLEVLARQKNPAPLTGLLADAVSMAWIRGTASQREGLRAAWPELADALDALAWSDEETEARRLFQRVDQLVDQEEAGP